MIEFKYIATENFLRIEEACRDAYENNLFIGIAGNSGWGKTFGFNSFKNNKKYKNVFLDEITASMDVKVFIEKIINDFKEGDYNANKLYYMILEASNLVKSLNSKSLFIIDEAGNFKIQMHKYIREFRDKVKDHSGLIISGPESFYQDLKNYRLKNRHGISEMMTRIDYWVELKPPTKEDMACICQANGLEDDKLINSMISKSNNFRTLNKKIERYLRKQMQVPKNAETA